MSDYREVPQPDPVPVVGYAAGWVGASLPVALPPKSVRSIEHDDMLARREDARKQYEVEQRLDRVSSRFAVSGEEPPKPRRHLGPGRSVAD